MFLMLVISRLSIVRITSAVSRIASVVSLKNAVQSTITRSCVNRSVSMTRLMADGVISGNPMVDLHVALVDGKFHTVDSSDMAFQVAGSLALKEAVEAAGVVLLEPVVSLEVVVPESFTGDIMGDLNSKRGKIQGMDQIGGGKQRIRALVPQSEVARYVIDLRSMTGGRGAFTMTASHYEEMPQHLASKVIQEYQKAREESQKK